MENTKETISRINGNGNEYISEVPKILLLHKDINDVVLTLIEKNTGLKFVQNHSGNYEVEPTTTQQIATLFCTCNFKTQYHNGIYFKNTLLLKFCDDKEFKQQKH